MRWSPTSSIRTTPPRSSHAAIRYEVWCEIRAAAGDTFAICVPVLTETLFGISLLPRALQNRAEWARFQPLLPCYSPDEADGAAAATLQVALRRRGRQLATVDALIAAIALRYDLVLLTTDRDFAPIATLAQENWLRPE